MEKNKVALEVIEDYGDTYTDQLSINETNIDDDINTTCTMRMEEDDDYDWIDQKERKYNSVQQGKFSFLNRNEKVAIVAAVFVVVIVATVLITRSITAPPCKEGWVEIGNKTCFKFYPQVAQKDAHLKKLKRYAN